MAHASRPGLVASFRNLARTVMPEYRLLTCPACGQMIGSDTLKLMALLGPSPPGMDSADILPAVKCLHCGALVTLPTWLDP